MSKINLLIVEDRCENLTHLKDIIKNDHISVVTVPTVIDAQVKLMDKKFDVLVTDIFIPNDIGEPINEKGGVELLDWVTMMDPTQRPSRIIGLTSHVACYNEHLPYFTSKGVVLIHADYKNEKWSEPIEATCEYLLGSLLVAPSTQESLSFDIAFITALGHNELKAILDLGIEWLSLIHI